MSRSWPTSQDYNEAVQNPQSSFADDELKAATAVTNSLGLPQACAGGVADVYHMRTANGQSWAVKCFTKRVSELRERYAAVAAHLENASLPFTVKFRFLDQGIRIQGEWYPVLKMEWIEGFTLAHVVRQNLGNPTLLQKLLTLWLKVEPQLRRANVAHGDLQHGNVMFVPDKDNGRFSLKLIDYDGLWVPALNGRQPNEFGHRSYQHPERRSENVYTHEIDRFPHLVIACALYTLAKLDGQRLWERYDTGENLLFTGDDFDSPETSRLLQELWSSGHSDLKSWSGHLAMAAKRSIVETPRLDDLIRNKRMPPLLPFEADAVGELLGASVPVRGQPKDSPADNDNRQTPSEARRTGTTAAVPRKSATAAKSVAAGETRTLGLPRIEMVWCPPGEFEMGSPQTEAGREPNEDQVHVRLTRGFWMGRFPVTQNQWQQVMGTEPWSEHKRVKTGKRFPTTYVSWIDARSFCKKLNLIERQAGRLGQHERFRLPTEAEWEYACRAGTTTSFSFGDDSTRLSQYGWYRGNSKELNAHAVGQKHPNAWNLHDMSGNVLEWCADWYLDRLPGGENPQVKVEEFTRVLRGGSWQSNPWLCRSAYRDGASPSFRDGTLGFRIVLEASATSPDAVLTDVDEIDDEVLPDVDELD